MPGSARLSRSRTNVFTRRISSIKKLSASRARETTRKRLRCKKKLPHSSVNRTKDKSRPRSRMLNMKSKLRSVMRSIGLNTAQRVTIGLMTMKTCLFTIVIPVEDIITATMIVRTLMTDAHFMIFTLTQTTRTGADSSTREAYLKRSVLLIRNSVSLIYDLRHLRFVMPT